MKRNKGSLTPLTLLAISFILVGCGGGNGNESSKDLPNSNQPIVTPPPQPSQNSKPYISAFEIINVLSESEVVIEPSAKDDDGDIIKYTWEQTSGPTVQPHNTQAAKLVFQAPSVDETQVIIFKLTVTDDDGETASESVKINVEANPIIINDPELIKCIELEYGTFEIDTVECKGYRIETLAGITSLTNLKRLTIEHAALTELKHLDEMPYLESLTLRSAFSGQVEDNVESISGVLNKLVSLRKLSIETEYINIISSLNFEQLVKLEALALFDLTEHSTKPHLNLSSSKSNSLTFLSLDSVYIRDFSTTLQANKVLETLILQNIYNYIPSKTDFFNNMKALKNLHLDSVGFYNGEGIKSLTQLKSLHLTYTFFSDLSFITPLSQLNDLSIIEHYYVFDLNWISSQSLNRLEIQSTNVINIQKLKELTTLKQLILTPGNNITIPNLYELTNLSTLELYCSDCVSDSFIESIPSVESLSTILDLEDDDFSKINKLKKLKELTISTYDLSKLLEQLKGNTNIEKLSVRYYSERPQNIVIELPNLVELSLDAGYYSKLPDISLLTSLESLNLIGFTLESIEGLGNNKNVKLISIADAKFMTDLTPLKQFPNLSELTLSNLDALSSFEPLQQIDSLTDLTIKNFQINDISPLSGLTRLKNLTLYNVNDFTGSSLDFSAFSENHSLEELLLFWINVNCDSLQQLDNVKTHFIHSKCQ
ncbi:hypothetical protein PSECIP111951_00558 [Pseudoalteromonas holothuriae]|uniref:PKD/Chitinase domain-containing protein n=1 Tax=Pseudoalteromonas holothuriae TaxID=2963714 RepID=A0ABN8UGZ0_9GAMM|nr:hypothetical protein [Pseudoalteromonas sp. CIP111951]CAH9052151.1 hypothetical protein PSECIP111951_00558 [Pseudoalteromonas sp. CIP111951]